MKGSSMKKSISGSLASSFSRSLNSWGSIIRKGLTTPTSTSDMSGQSDPNEDKAASLPLPKSTFEKDVELLVKIEAMAEKLRQQSGQVGYVSPLITSPHSVVPSQEGSRQMQEGRRFDAARAELQTCIEFYLHNRFPTLQMGVSIYKSVHDLTVVVKYNCYSGGVSFDQKVEDSSYLSFEHALNPRTFTIDPAIEASLALLT